MFEEKFACHQYFSKGFVDKFGYTTKSIIDEYKQLVRRGARLQDLKNYKNIDVNFMLYRDHKVRLAVRIRAFERVMWDVSIFGQPTK